MNDALIIILIDHPLEHTSDYAIQTAKFLSQQNITIGWLTKDAVSLKEIVFNRQQFLWWKKVNPHYYLFQPLYIFPFRRFKKIVNFNIWLNSKVMQLYIRLKYPHRVFKIKYIWIFNPEQYQISRYFDKSFVSIYDCVDFHEGKDNYLDENSLIRSVDHFFVNSHALFKFHASIRKAHIVPQGFRLEEFRSSLKIDSIQIPHDKPVIGYVGGINYRLDFTLLHKLIVENSKYNFVFVGPIQLYESFRNQSVVLHQIREMFQLTNCIHYADQPKNVIAIIIKRFDIGIIPYDVRYDFNKYCYPMKLFEYFYMGKPVIATPIHELSRFPTYVKIGSTSFEWEYHMKHLLSSPWPTKFKIEQRRLAIENSWKNKIVDIARIFDKQDWSVTLTKNY